MKTRKIFFLVIGSIILLYTLSFTSCETLFDCQKCTNRNNEMQWGCGDHEREQLESQGYTCE
jgi:hypothetical protein